MGKRSRLPSVLTAVMAGGGAYLLSAIVLSQFFKTPIAAFIALLIGSFVGVFFGRIKRVGVREQKTSQDSQG